MIRILAGLALVILAGCQVDQPVAARTTPAGQCRATPVFEAAPLNACAPGPRVSLAIVGDVLLHWQLQQLGYARDFRHVWAQAAPFIEGADIAIANLEGPVAPGLTRAGAKLRDPGPVWGSDVYTGFPTFNYHPKILADLKAGGFDLVTTANNHSMDRGARGADLTLAELSRAGLPSVGMIRGGAARDFVLRRQTAAGTLSFIACSFSTNGLPDPERQVLMCYRDKAELLSMVRREVADPKVAGVIVLPHWGVEYSNSPNAQQRALAQDLVGAGATAVVGTHPHVAQPFQVVAGPQGATPVLYSTGNFIAVQDHMGAMALLDLCPGPDGRLVTHQAGWIAMQMRFSPTAYWLDVAPAGSSGVRGAAAQEMARIAPGFSAQPQCR